MNGVHDIGGMDGFGPVHREPDEPVFHEPWEAHVFGTLIFGAGLPPSPLDAGRHRLERLDPVSTWLPATTSVDSQGWSPELTQRKNDPQASLCRHRL